MDWPAAQTAAAHAAGRLSTLLRSVQHPEAPALGRWNVTDVAAHISHSLDATGAMAAGGGGVLTDLWDLSMLTEGMVQGESERNLAALADRIVATTTRFLATVRAAGEDGARPWLIRGVELPLSTLTCQVLNELVVHGRDIAVAEKAPWPVSRTDATLILQGYLLPVLSALGSAMVDREAAAGLRATYDVRLRGGGRATFVFDDGDLTVTQAPPEGRVDCHLSVDPTTFLLVAWGRLSQAEGIAKGQLLAWGRKPWLGLKLRSLLRNP